MSEHHNTHHAPDYMAWVDKHMGGLIMEFGKRFERFADFIMMPIVNHWFQRLALVYLALFAPFLVMEFIFQLAL